MLYTCYCSFASILILLATKLHEFLRNLVFPCHQILFERGADIIGTTLERSTRFLPNLGDIYEEINNVNRSYKRRVRVVYDRGH